MTQASRCPQCGGALIVGRCVPCDTRRWAGLVHREIIILAALVVVTVVAFIGTRAVAISNEVLRREQAAAWFDAAQSATGSDNPGAAVTRFRRAVLKDPENRQYRLALADALTAYFLEEEAQRVLVALREAQPEDPEANLRLARLARASDPDAARRYYQAASAGLWQPEHADTRRQVQAELIQFLLDQDEQARALSELLVLAANLPEDAAVHAQVGRMFLAAGDPGVAHDRFLDAIRLDADNEDALAGAGEAAFALGEYADALRYLNAVPPENESALALRELTELVLTADPLAPRLGASERRRRLTAAFQQAVQRLEACLADAATSASASASLAPIHDEALVFTSVLELPARRAPQDFVDDGLDLTYRIERAVDGNCDTPSAPLDRALVLIGRRHGFEQ